MLHVVGDDDLAGLRGGGLDGRPQSFRLSAVTPRLLPVERVRLSHAAPLHGPLEDAGDHGVVRLVRILKDLEVLHELFEVRGKMFQKQPEGVSFSRVLLTSIEF